MLACKAGNMAKSNLTLEELDELIIDIAITRNLLTHIQNKALSPEC